MNTKLIVFFAAMALVLVGCNKEKEENVGTTVVSTEQQQQQQQQQVVPNATNVSDNAVLANISTAATASVPTSAAPPVTVPTPPVSEQGGAAMGQQQVIPQTSQAVEVNPSQTAPVIDSQNQAQPAQPMSVVPTSDQQNATSSVSTVQVPVIPTAPAAGDGNAANPSLATPPVVHGGVVPGPSTPATPGTGGMVMAAEPTPTQNVYGAPTVKSGMQQHSVGSNAQLAAPAPIPTAPMGTAGVVGQTTDVVGTKA